MDALVALRDHRAHAEEERALGRPVARGAAAVLLARDHHEGRPLRLVALGRVVDVHPLARGHVDGDAALDPRHHRVLEADVREGAAHHHPVVPAARAVGVEVLLLDPLRHQEAPGRARRAAMSPAGEMWSVVTESPRTARTRAPTMSVSGGGLLREALEEGRLLDVGRVLPEGEEVAARHRDRVPVGVAVEHVPVARLEHLGPDRGLELGHLLLARPDVGELDRGPVDGGADRLGREVDVGRAGEGVGHHEGRRGEVVGLHVRVHPALEVAVAGEHGGGHELAVVHGLRHLGGQRARCCRCRSCSRSPPRGSRGPRGRAGGPPCAGTRSPPSSPGRGSS